MDEGRERLNHQPVIRFARQDEARELNEEIFETIYFAACEASCELAELQGPYETYPGVRRITWGENTNTHRIHGAGIYANIKGVYWW